MINNHSLSYTPHSFYSLYFILIRIAGLSPDRWNGLSRLISLKLRSRQSGTQWNTSAIDHAILTASHLATSRARHTACIYNSRYHDPITSSTSAPCPAVHHLPRSRSYNRPLPIRHLQYHFDLIIYVSTSTRATTSTTALDPIPPSPHLLRMNTSTLEV